MMEEFKVIQKAGQSQRITFACYLASSCVFGLLWTPDTQEHRPSCVEKPPGNHAAFIDELIPRHPRKLSCYLFECQKCQGVASFLAISVKFALETHRASRSLKYEAGYSIVSSFLECPFSYLYSAAQIIRSHTTSPQNAILLCAS